MGVRDDNVGEVGGIRGVTRYEALFSASQKVKSEIFLDTVLKLYKGIRFIKKKKKKNDKV